MIPIFIFTLLLQYCSAKHGIFFTENQTENVFTAILSAYNQNLEIFGSYKDVNRAKEHAEIEFFFHSDDKIIPDVVAPGKDVNVYFYKNNNNSLVTWENLENLSSFDLIFTETKADLQHFIEQANPILVELASKSLYVPLIRILGPSSGHRDKITNLVNRIRGELPFKEYIKEALPIFKTKNIKIAAKSENVAVIIESAVHPALELVVRNVMFYLESGWSLIVYHSKENEFFIKNALKDLSNIEFRLPYFPIYSVSEYNHFMKMHKFYESLNAKKVLIFQTDSIMLKKGMERFMQYDYVGAPWHWHGRCGNGGFSLRSVDVMMRACLSAFSDHNVNMNEDVIFSEFVSKHYKLAPFNEAFSFAREHRAPTLDHMSAENNVIDSHLALHQTWLFLDKTVMRKILKHSIEKLKTEYN